MPDQPEPAPEPRTTTDHVPRPADTVSFILAPADTIDLIDSVRVTAPTGPGLPVPPADAPAIPGYAIESLIAQGGMGRVYAGRDLALDRQVAIKTHLPGANAERFVVEAKITARLPHPGIPPVHALGVLADGTPYLAMKLIRGRTLAELLKERASPQADLSRFVQIFEQIAQAVGFAHAQGIIHRDLKPLNVMVGSFGEVQVMDWGLAKDLNTLSRRAHAAETPPASAAKARRLSEEQQTRDGAILGTPGYMAPEQARGEPADARSDVFSLGSILATMLTGQSAFAGMKPREMVTKAAAGDLSGVLERLATSGADVELIALAKRCLSAVPKDRPTDAQAVAVEVSAYRANVEHRLRQAETQAAEALVREAEQRKRRRTLQIAAATISAILLLGVIGTSAGMYRANVAKQEAQTANELTAQRLAQIEMINNSVFDIFTDFDIRKIKEGNDPVEYILAQRLIATGRRLDAKAIRDPLILARLQNRLGHTLLSLGEAKAAIEFLTSAREIRQAKLGSEHPDTLTSMSNLANGYGAVGKLDLALPLYEETLQLMMTKLGPDHPYTLSSMGNLAEGYRAVGKLDLALPLLEKTLQLSKAKLGPNHSDTLNSMNNLAGGYNAVGKLDLSLRLLKETLERTKVKLGPDHPQTLGSMNNLAGGYEAVGKLDLALPLYEETLQFRKARLGPDHPETLNSMGNLAGGYQAAGKLDLALPLYEATLQLTKAKLGPDHPATLRSMGNLAEGYRAAGKFDLALRLLEKTLQLGKAQLGPDHPETLTNMNNLALNFQAVGRLDLALPLYEETLQLRKSKLGASHPETLNSMNNLAGGYRDADKLDLALPLYKETLELTKAKLGPNHPATLRSMNNLAEVYQAVGKLDLALPLFEETLQLMKAKLGPDHPQTLTTMGNLAAVYWSMRKLDKSVPLFEQVLKQQEEQLGRRHPSTMLTIANLGVNLKDAGELGSAIPLLEEAHAFSREHPPLKWVSEVLLDAYVRVGNSAKSAALVQDFVVNARQSLPKERPQFASTLVNLGQILIQTQAFAEAEKLLRESVAIREKADADAWTTFNAQSMLGEALLGQQKFADAEPLLLKGYEGIKAREKSIPPDAATLLPEAIDRLIEFYTATDKPDELKKWQAEREKYPVPASPANSK